MRVIGDIARLNAKRWPNKKALIMGEDSLTYGQLNHQANQLAHGLLSRGVSPGDRIAVLAHNSLEAVVINYAVSKCGGIVVPANFRYKKDELVYLINDCEPKLLLFGGDFASLVEEAKPRFTRPVGLVSIFREPLEKKGTLRDLMNGKSTAEPTLDVDPASAFTITYTSGTTGARPRARCSSRTGRSRSGLISSCARNPGRGCWDYPCNLCGSNRWH